ncbi:hypothetical protein OPIT5_16805 [Opitutaceae bacterium TAV5]|nr:hypothetical protein OPIT5_16805 [Opitutaceae bacterium TAV5]
MNPRPRLSVLVPLCVCACLPWSSVNASATLPPSPLPVVSAAVEQKTAPVPDTKPHPVRKDRLVATFDSLQVEYSSGQEAYVRAIEKGISLMNAAALDKVGKGNQSKFPEPPPALGIRDLRENRAAYLLRIAIESGIPAATENQRLLFDLFTNAADQEKMAEMRRLFLKPFLSRKIDIWDRDALTQRLSSGESIDGFSYDAATNTGTFDFAASYQTPPYPELERSPTDLPAFRAADYVVRNGIAGFSPEFLDQLQKADSTPRFVNLFRVNPGGPAISKPMHFPVILTRENRGAPPEETVGEALEAIGQLTDLADQFSLMIERGLSYMTLRTVAYVGIFESYIGTADREWFCQGAADYIAWKTISRQAGKDMASHFCDLDSELAQSASELANVDILHGWPAPENRPAPETGEHEAAIKTGQEKDERPGTVSYSTCGAVAARVFFLIAARHGDDAVKTFLAGVSATPRDRTTTATIAKALEDTTGENLAALIAETRIPLSTLPVSSGTKS